MSIYFIKIIIDDFVKVQMFFLIILLSAIPNFAYALSDTEYNDLISSSHDFKEADTEMNNLWDNLYKNLKQERKLIILKDQLHWLNNKRDDIASEYIKKGLNWQYAYTQTTLERINVLRILEYNSSLPQQLINPSASRPIKFYFTPKGKIDVCIIPKQMDFIKEQTPHGINYTYYVSFTEIPAINSDYAFYEQKLNKGQHRLKLDTDTIKNNLYCYAYIDFLQHVASKNYDRDIDFCVTIDLSHMTIISITPAG